MTVSSQEERGGSIEVSTAVSIKVHRKFKLWVVTNTSASPVSATLQDARTLARRTGDLVFCVINHPSSVGDIDVLDNDGASILSSDLAPGESVNIWLSNASTAAGAWHTRRDTVGALSNPPDDEDWFLLGGQSGIASEEDDALQYSAQTDTWTTKSSAADRHIAAAAASNGPKGFICGSNNGGLNDLNSYDPDVWTALADLSINQNFHCAAYLSPNLYAASLNNGSGVREDIDEYDISGNTWSSKTSRGINANQTTAKRTSIGLMVVFGGHLNFAQAHVGEYSAAGDAWSAKGDMTFPGRSFAGSARRDDGHVFLFGGFNNTPIVDFLDNNDEYDDEFDSWSSRTDIPTGNQGEAAGGTAAGTAYYTGGNNFGKDDHMAYDMDLDVWTSPLAELPNASGKDSVQNQGVGITV
jgi:hypothetical protein